MSKLLNAGHNFTHVDLQYSELCGFNDRTLDSDSNTGIQSAGNVAETI